MLFTSGKQELQQGIEAIVAAKFRTGTSRIDALKSSVSILIDEFLIQYLLTVPVGSSFKYCRQQACTIFKNVKAKNEFIDVIQKSAQHDPQAGAYAGIIATAAVLSAFVERGLVPALNSLADGQEEQAYDLARGTRQVLAAAPVQPANLRIIKDKFGALSPRATGYTEGGYRSRRSRRSAPAGRPIPAIKELALELDEYVRSDLGHDLIKSLQSFGIERQGSTLSSAYELSQMSGSTAPTVTAKPSMVRDRISSLASSLAKIFEQQDPPVRAWDLASRTSSVPSNTSLRLDMRELAEECAKLKTKQPVRVSSFSGSDASTAKSPRSDKSASWSRTSSLATTVEDSAPSIGHPELLASNSLDSSRRWMTEQERYDDFVFGPNSYCSWSGRI